MKICGCSGRKESIGPASLAPEKRPDWYEDLQDTQINMFKEVGISTSYIHKM